MPHYTLNPLQLSPPFRAAARFAPAFPGFDGHFPGRPLLPGFMHIQLALDLLQHVHPNASLATLSNAKFSRPIVPDEDLFLELSPSDTPLNFEATLSTAAGEPCSRFTLQLRQDETTPCR